jgi:uncharacterized protein YjbI with pentapeptide repeats
MKTKNLTPFLFGAKLTSRKPPQLEMTAIVRGAFRFAPGEPLTPLAEALPISQGMMTAETFHDDDVERQGECLYGGDFADFKLNAEVMLRGTCHTPGNKAVKECPVRFTVGAWSKLLRVFGRRVWSDTFGGAAMSEPLLFTEMPLGYTHAFGGPGYAQNPSGKGVSSSELPNVEHAGELVRSRKDRIAPAGFGPYNPAWPQRGGKVGREYGKAWLEKRAPFYAEDFDWTHFHAAPPDQQLPGYLRGDEEIVLQNLHPREAVWSSRLPGLRVRLFVKDTRGRFREVRMSLDTLFAAPDEQTLYLTWRGLDKVEEDDLTDVATVLVASEKLDDAPLPAEHYLGILEKYEGDPLEIQERLPAHMLAARDRLKKRHEEPRDDTPAPDAVSGALQNELGGLDPALQKKIKAETAAGVAALTAATSPAGLGPEAPPIDIKGALEKAAAGPKQRSLPRVLPFKPGYLPPIAISGDIAKIKAGLAEARAKAAEHGQELGELDELEKKLDGPEIGKLVAAERPPVEPGPGRDLSGMDFTGRDLSGLDLRGANLEATILTGANLIETRLDGANLRYAVLVQADLARADLTGADLAFANLSEARAPGARLGRTTLQRTFFRKADLSGATLAEARGEFSVFQETNLDRADLHGVRWFKMLLRDARLEGADLSGAELSRCYFLGVAAQGLNLRGALLDHTSFADSKLRKACAVDARGEGSIWLRTVLEDADFSFAVLPAAHFTEARAARIRFFGANLKGARFYRASLEQAEIVHANLFGADLSKAVLTGARFTHANLYDAKFIKAAGAGCDFTGANLKRCTLENA